MKQTFQSHTAGVMLMLMIPMLALAPVEAQAKKLKANEINLTPTIQSIDLVDGQLIASGVVSATIDGATTVVPFIAPVNLSLADDQSGAGACPILELELGPIELNLLGLVVETSPICLTITAYEGGGLLGDLLCTVATLLDNGISLEDILALEDSEDLLAGLQDLLNEALHAKFPKAILTDITLLEDAGTCAILHLELGPLTLDLLGLVVELDDCDGGPVIVDITAETGEGNLLGNLLCGLLGDGQIELGMKLKQILKAILGAL